MVFLSLIIYVILHSLRPFCEQNGSVNVEDSYGLPFERDSIMMVVVHDRYATK